MSDLKMQAAAQAIKLIKPGQVIGIGDGTTMLHIVDMIVADKQLMQTLTITSSAVKTLEYLETKGITSIPLNDLSRLDIYFDGCDQFDKALNAFKSGSGIHTMEKIAAFMASEFILVGDSAKYSPTLTAQYPLVIEVLPAALASVMAKIKTDYPEAKYLLRQNGDSAAVTLRGNYLLEMRFDTLPDLASLNTSVKMLPGVLNHSLFYRMATQAIIAGAEGISTIQPEIEPVV